MLARKDFRRSHDGGLHSMRRGLDHGKEGDDGLAAADVALDQPGHHFLSAEIAGDLRPYLLLGVRQLIGKRAEDLLRLRGSRQGIAVLFSHPSVLQLAQHQDEEEEFLKNKPVSCLGQGSSVFRKMDRPQCPDLPRQAVLLSDRVRERIIV